MSSIKIDTFLLVWAITVNHTCITSIDTALHRTHGFKICGNTPKYGEIRLSQNLQFNAVSIEFTDNSEKKIIGKTDLAGPIFPTEF
jgi:hypothetical protein